MRGVAEAAIAEASSVSGVVESRVASLAVHAKANTVHTVSELSKCVADAVGHMQEQALRALLLKCRSNWNRDWRQ